MFRPVLVAALVAGFMVSACTHQATVSPVAPQTVHSNYQSKVAGHFALFVNSEKMSQPPRIKGIGCGVDVSISLDASKAMKASVLASIEKVVEKIELVDEPIAAGQLSAEGYDAIIIAEVEKYSVDLSVTSEFFTSDITADAEMRVAFKADTRAGRTTGGLIEDDADHTNSMGSLCSGAKPASSAAVEKLMGSVASKISERISNSNRLRVALESDF